MGVQGKRKPREGLRSEGLSYRGDPGEKLEGVRIIEVPATKGKPEERQDLWSLRTWGAGVLRPYKGRRNKKKTQTIRPRKRAAL